MKAIALLIAALMVLLGLTGVLWPEGVMPLMLYSFSRGGIYAAAAIRIILGGLLFFAATPTRTPKTIRVVGLILVIAGIATALIPLDRAQSIKDWWVTRGPDTIRIVACFPLVAGIFIGLSALTKERKS
jgi:hypothetical protein